jgi:hypothetical protein
VIGIVSWYVGGPNFKVLVLTLRLYLPPSPTQTKRHGIKGLLRSKEGWFTEREEVIMVNRVLRDDPGKSTMHNVSSQPSSSSYASSNRQNSVRQSASGFYGRVSLTTICE